MNLFSIKELQSLGGNLNAIIQHNKTSPVLSAVSLATLGARAAASAHTELLEAATVWVPNTEQCQRCNMKFTFFKRRHHCRYCGRCICQDCSNQTFQKQRICRDCNHS